MSSRLVAVAAFALVVAAAGAADARDGTVADRPRVALVLDGGCSERFERQLCVGFERALRTTGVAGRIVTTTSREDPEDTLEILAKQYDLVIAFGVAFYEPLGAAARRQPRARFAILGTSRTLVPRSPRNVQGVVFRTSEAAYLAGWLGARTERSRPGPDAVGVVGGIKLPSVDDFVIGFRAGARRSSPSVRVLVGYSQDFVDQSRCKAIARRQLAQGAGVVFNVAGACGLGTLRAVEEAGAWGVGVDVDQSFLGPHILTSVLVRYDAGLLMLVRQVRTGRIVTGRDTVLTLRDDAVGLGKISPRVPASLRTDLAALERRVASGSVSVPGVFPDPR